MVLPFATLFLLGVASLWPLLGLLNSKSHCVSDSEERLPQEPISQAQVKRDHLESKLVLTCIADGPAETDDTEDVPEYRRGRELPTSLGLELAEDPWGAAARTARYSGGQNGGKTNFREPTESGSLTNVNI